jgi:DNA-binding CsgD family transcriptional regulator
MGKKSDLISQYAEEIRWIQKADAYQVAKFIDECTKASEILKVAHAIVTDITDLFPGLTENQKTVVRLAMAGKSYDVIGEELGKAQSTVADAMQRAMRKMGATSKEDLLQLCMELLREAFR